jgi:putative flippase GtrA
LSGLTGRLVRFGLVGGVATGLQYLLLIVLVREAGLWPTVASGVGFAISAVVNYLLNYHFTFRSRRPHGPALARFMTLAVVGLAINSVLMQVLLGAGWYYLVAQLGATTVVFLWNFVGNSVWTFAASAHAGAGSRP